MGDDDLNDNVFIQKYLNRINYHDNIGTDINTLRKLQKQHLLTVPFENLNLFSETAIEFDVNKMWHKIVEEKRGGICYELNGLFFHLLKQIGFEVKYLSAKVLKDGSEFDHVLLIVNIGGNSWLSDVGFGDNFLEPLEFKIGEAQKDMKGYFKIVRYGKDEYQLLKSLNKTDYSLEYTFTLQERNLEDFRERCLYFQFSPDSKFKKNRLCSIEKEDGRISLTDKKLTITENNRQIIKKIKNNKDFLNNLEEIFNISLVR